MVPGVRGPWARPASGSPDELGEVGASLLHLAAWAAGVPRSWLCVDRETEAPRAGVSPRSGHWAACTLVVLVLMGKLRRRGAEQLAQGHGAWSRAPGGGTQGAWCPACHAQPRCPAHLPARTEHSLGGGSRGPPISWSEKSLLMTDHFLDISRNLWAVSQSRRPEWAGGPVGDCALGSVPAVSGTRCPWGWQGCARGPRRPACPLPAPRLQVTFSPFSLPSGAPCPLPSPRSPPAVRDPLAESCIKGCL